MTHFGRSACRHKSFRQISYVRNDPVNRFDPDGREDEPYIIHVTVWDAGAAFMGLGWYDNQYQMFITFLYQPGILQQILGAASAAAQQMQHGIGGGGGGGDAPTINSEKGVFWNRPRFNNAVTTEMRRSIVSSTLTGLNKRILDQDCSSFIDKVIGNLEGLLKSGIASASSLVSQGLNAATLHIYGAKYSPALRQHGSAFAETNNNDIYLGEHFFNPATYAQSQNAQAYQVSTLIHEMFHLSAISSTGDNLKESELNRAAGGDFKGAVISNCGLK